MMKNLNLHFLHRLFLRRSLIKELDFNAKIVSPLYEEDDNIKVVDITNSDENDLFNKSSH